MAVSERDKHYMQRLAASLARAEVETVDAPAVDPRDEEEPPELELHRRAKRLGMVRGGR